MRSAPVSGCRAGFTPGETLRAELATFWPTLYPKFEKVPVRIEQEQSAIQNILLGEKKLASDVSSLRLFDKGGALDPHTPLAQGWLHGASRRVQFLIRLI